MGGRGSRSYTIVSRLPNFKNAVIARDKLKNYILNPSKSNGKSKFFNDLGYNMKNYKLLEAHIMQKLATNKALKYEKGKDGRISFQVNMALGVNRKEMVLTAWSIDAGSKIPRFVTAYKNDSKYFKKNRE